MNKVQYDSAGVRTQTCRSGVQPAAVFVYIPHDDDQSHDILLISAHDREFYAILFIISDRDETLLHVDCHTATIKREAIQALTMIFSLPYFLQFKGITSSAGYGEPSSYRNESGRLIVEVSTQWIPRPLRDEKTVAFSLYKNVYTWCKRVLARKLLFCPFKKVTWKVSGYFYGSISRATETLDAETNFLVSEKA